MVCVCIDVTLTIFYRRTCRATESRLSMTMQMRATRIEVVRSVERLPRRGSLVSLLCMTWVCASLRCRFHDIKKRCAVIAAMRMYFFSMMRGAG
ncbi:MAG: hypothetical protein DCC74_07945 [Proteobacteria bacterium]|nr:MAG: hypothetical protein DCC74_07945 [Pseudomonadota bacterium]